MKKLLILIAIASTIGTTAFACEICGCAMTGNYNGIYPQFSNNIVGLRYGYSQFTHPYTDENYNGTSRVKSDAFQTAEVWGRFYPSDRVQILAFVPYKIHERVETDRTTTIQGIGDITAMANFTVINTGDSSDVKLKQTWLLGGGLTLPTGKYQQRDENGTFLPAQFQIGTGAYSFRAMTNYTIRYEALGLNANVEYITRTENERSYQFGDSYSFAASAFYWIKFKDISIIPNIGIGYENYAPDYELDEEKESTGGTLNTLSAGVDLNVKRLFVRVFMQSPFNQDLPPAQPTSGNRYNASVGLVF